MKLKFALIILLLSNAWMSLSAQQMESSYYFTTEPLRYLSRTVNFQYGSKSHADRLAYWQIGAASTLGKYGNDFFTGLFNITDFSEIKVEKRLNLAIDIQYRIVVRNRNFWAPFVTGYVDHFVFRNTNTQERFNNTTLGAGVGVVNGRFYNRNDMGFLGVLYWGVGAAYLKDYMYFPKPDGGYNTFSPIIMLGWQFGLKR